MLSHSATSAEFFFYFPSLRYIVCASRTLPDLLQTLYTAVAKRYEQCNSLVVEQEVLDKGLRAVMANLMELYQQLDQQYSTFLEKFQKSQMETEKLLVSFESDMKKASFYCPISLQPALSLCPPPPRCIIVITTFSRRGLPLLF
jgi:hypothetical protein